MSNLNQNPQVSKSFITGLASGFASTVVLQPFDFIKTQLQRADAPPSLPAVIRNFGFLGLWQGTIPTLWRNVPGIALYFTTLSRLRPALAQLPVLQANGRLSSTGDALAGATSRVAVGFLLNPLAVIKARVEGQVYSSFGGGLLAIVREGHRGLLLGAGASALRDAPYAAVHMAIYQRLKVLGTQFNAPNGSSTVVNTVAAAAAAAAAGITTHPFDVVKTRIQVRNEAQYRTIRGTVIHIWITRGLRGFFDGFSLRFGRKMASSTIAWVVYEAILERWQ